MGATHTPGKATTRAHLQREPLRTPPPPGSALHHALVSPLVRALRTHTAHKRDHGRDRKRARAASTIYERIPRVKRVPRMALGSADTPRRDHVVSIEPLLLKYGSPCLSTRTGTGRSTYDEYTARSSLRMARVCCFAVALCSLTGLVVPAAADRSAVLQLTQQWQQQLQYHAAERVSPKLLAASTREDQQLGVHMLQQLRGGGATLSRLLPILLGRQQCRILMVCAMPRRES